MKKKKNNNNPKNPLCLLWVKNFIQRLSWLIWIRLYQNIFPTIDTCQTLFPTENLSVWSQWNICEAWSVIKPQEKKFNIFQGEGIIQAANLDYNAEKINVNAKT